MANYLRVFAILPMVLYVMDPLVAIDSRYGLGKEGFAEGGNK